MKKNLHFFTLLAFILFETTTQAQLTQLSNNTNIRSGVALGSIGVLADKNGLLYKTNGTAGGTASYANLKVRVDTTVQYVTLNGKIYFAGIDVTATTGTELWVTDGTDAGTQLVKDIYTGTHSSYPRNLFVFNNAIYFFARAASNGVELWKSDGTSGGTSLVKDINPGADSSYDDTYTTFFANNNVLYFNANDGTHGTELWKTDGTSGGTVMIKDINAGAFSSNVENLTALGTTVLFSATDATHGAELWKTDGTAAGTVLVKDIASGANGSSPGQFVVLNNKVLFTTVNALFQFSIYSTDGTGAGTTLVKSFALGSFPLLSFSVIINNKLFFNATTAASGSELWSTDGTTAGTALFDDINPGPASSGAFLLPDFLSFVQGGNYQTHLFNGKIFFMADDGTHGSELWITDGTLAGTKMVKDINPGADSSLNTGSGEFSVSWFYTSTTFYFSANDGTHGNELWKTDGTSANTSLVEDLNPGSGDSDPFMFMFLSNHIYLTADNGDNGNGNRDLYIIDANVTLPVSLLSFTATLNNKAVDLNWSTATETNTKNYNIQRSYNGMQFQNVGSVNAAGNSTKKIDYKFTDADALQTSANKIYYRLQIADNDGKTTFSNIASVNILPDGNLLVVYPNPVKDQLFFITHKAVDAAIVRISNVNGKLVYVQQLGNIPADAKNKLNVAALGKGVYYLEFISGSNKQTIRFIKY